MTHSFIWCDLSTYFPEKSISFYKKIFQWDIENNEGYQLVYAQGELVCGIYETPDFFKKIKMPHFWMNYIQVENHDKTIELAEQNGGKIELKNVPFYGGKIALIRDPLGAGFTIYEGKSLYQSDKVVHGNIAARTLQISNIDTVRNFYTHVFQWRLIEVKGNNTFKLIDQEARLIAHIEVIPNNLKGKYEYWVNTFYVNDLENTIQLILDLGGKTISNENSRMLCTDHFGEAFFYIQEMA